MTSPPPPSPDEPEASNRQQSMWPAVHLLLALLSTAAFAIMICHAGSERDVLAFLHDRRSSLYSTAVGLSGTVLGFSLASLTFAFGLADSPRLAVLRDAGWLGPLYDVFIGALQAFALMLGASIAALLFDRDAHPNRLLTSLLVGALVLGVLRLLRLVTVLSALVRALVRSQAH